MTIKQQTVKPFYFNGFMMGVVGHLSAGLWRHPDDKADNYTDIDYWVHVAKLLDDAGFDAIFIADALGQLDVYQGSPDAALRTASQSPVIDPLLLISAMAAATRDIGFGVTVSTTYEQPYLLARKFTTLDHITRGRIAWNVVTSVLDSAARNLGLEKQIDHDERYDRAQEFLEVSYKLWEGSWQQDALVRDKQRGIYVDASKVLPIQHQGRYFKVPGAHLSAPGPQRTPVIFQAGASSRGVEFAASNAEVVFLGGALASDVRRSADVIRARAQQLGRDRESIRFITAVTVVTAESDELAQAKYQDYLRYVDRDAALTLFSAWTGVDWSTYPLDKPLEYIETNAIRSALETFTRIDSEKQWTLGEVADYIGVGGLHPTLVGGPETVADLLEQYAEESGVDGFNLAYAISPGTFEDFVHYVVPELKKRGRIRPRSAQPLTLRENLFGQGLSHLPDNHPGAVFRDLSVR